MGLSLILVRSMFFKYAKYFFNVLGPVHVKDQQIPHPTSLKSSQIVFLVQKDEQCSETYEKQFSDFYFLRNRRFCAQNAYQINKNKSPKMAKKMSQKMRNVLKPMKKQFSNFCDFIF